jgi:hypothetical protein
MQNHLNDQMVGRHFMTMKEFIPDLDRLWAAMSKAVADFIPTRLRVENKRNDLEIWRVVPLIDGGIDITVFRSVKKEIHAVTLHET